MSAYRARADVLRDAPRGPRLTQSGLRARSVDHLVGAQQERLRYRQAERLRGLEINYQFEFTRLLDGYVRRLVPLQDLVHKQRHLPIQGGSFVAIRHQATSFGKRTKACDCRQTVLE